MIERDTPELARRTTLELGMPVTPARYYPPMAASYFGYYAGWADKLEGATIPVTPPSGFDYTLLEPYGVVGIIITWNGPLASIGMKVAPALAAGNCVILKSPELAPFAAEHFARLALEAGVPPGVLTCFPAGRTRVTASYGTPTSRRSRSPAVAPPRARSWARAETITPLALELGGKSANLLFADADLDAAVRRALFQCMANAGQGCSFPTRLLVERPAYDDVVTRLSELAPTIRVGDPFAAETQMGPVVCADACDRILAVIERAKSTARSVAGGARLGGELAGGFFIEPTVFADVAPDDPLFRDEVFGPVLSITPFDTEDEAVGLANSTVYGLAAYVQSRDIARVHRIVPQLTAGTVHVNGKSAMPPNAPFGGYGESGFGREGGKAGLDEFLQIKNVFVQAG